MNSDNIKCKIEDALKAYQINKIFDMAQNISLYPIYIVSYKNRYDRLFMFFEQNKIEFTIVVYSDDYYESSYHNYDFKYGKFLIITPELFNKYGLTGKSIQKKRYFLQKYLEDNHITKYFMLDDDFRTEAEYSVEPSHSNPKFSKRARTDIIIALKTMQLLFNAYNLSIASIGDPFTVSHFKFNNPIKYGNTNASFLINGVNLTNAGVYFDTEESFEDTDISIKATLAKLNVGKIAFLNLLMNPMNNNTVTNVNREPMSFNLYKKYPWCIKPVVRCNTLIHRIYNVKFLNTNKYNKELHNLAKTMSVEEFKAYLLKNPQIKFFDFIPLLT